MFALPSSVNITLQVLASTIRQEKEIHMGKEGVKLSLFSDMIIYIKSLMESTK